MLRYIVSFESTNPKPAIYRNLYENTGPGCYSIEVMMPVSPALYIIMGLMLDLVETI